MRHALIAGLAMLAAPPPLTAQTASPARSAAASITAGGVAHRIGVIADDSMLGRDTPSRGLELTAAYIAAQFKRFGLRPAGDGGGYLQRYRIIRRRLDAAGSRLVFRAGDATAEARFDSTARYVRGGVPGGPIAGPVVLVGGRLTVEAVGRMALRDKLVLYASDVAGAQPEQERQVVRAIRQAGPRAVLLVADVTPQAFRERIPRSLPARPTVDLALADAPVVEVNQPAMEPALRAAGLDLATVRADTAPVMRELPALRGELTLRDSVLSAATAPNTVGILPGSDPDLRHEYLVFSAHMDHIGVSPGLADSINNGADDDASGTTGVMELAQAFSRPGGRPRRSIIFLTVSGEEKGLWGSRYFTEHPPAPIGQIVADFNLDMIGRNWRDTIVAIGREHSDLGATLALVNQRHPELGMTAIDDRWPEERFYFRSDHYNFARKGVPILFFFNGVHPDYHRPSDSPDKIDGEKEARILRLLYYLGREVGDAPRRPQWNQASYDSIVDRP